MEFWNNIINTALLGTDKKQLSTNELPIELAGALEKINANSIIDREEKFFQISSVALNYRACGASPVINKNAVIKESEEESQTYCSREALHVLQDILSEQSNSLLSFWLRQCIGRQLIVYPEIIPALFDLAANQKKMRSLVTSCCGKRGEWLSLFNPEWNFYQQESEEETWQNGTSDQRKKLLQKLREFDPLKARELLQQTWNSENANSKSELLKQLEINISAEDLPWLETLREEKSQKVKEVVFDLLKQIPGSSIVSDYWNILQKSIMLKKEKALLGMIAKTSLQVTLVDAGENIFKSGIEKLSSSKDFTDEEFIVYQLIESIPPVNWEIHLNSKPAEIINYFQKEKTRKFLPAIAKAIIKFKNQPWALSFLEHCDVFYTGLISILPEEQQDKWSIKFFEGDPENMIALAKERDTEWSYDLAKNIFKYTAKNVYQYNKAFYNYCINLIPGSIVADLERFSRAEQHIQSTWSNIGEYIVKLIALKQQTIHSFQ